MPAILTILDSLETAAAASREAVALLAPERLPSTYGQLQQQALEVAGFLRSRGIGDQDRVAVVLPNGPDLAAAFLSVTSCATCAPLPVNLPAGACAYYLENMGAKALILKSSDRSAARTVAGDLNLPVFDLAPGRNAGVFSLDDTGCPPGARQASRAGPNDVALVLHTSGTTARPKIVPLTHVNLLSSARNHVEALQLEAKDRCLNFMPLTHIHGLVSAVLSSIHAGGSVCCLPGFSAESFCEWLEKYQPTWYTASPAFHRAVLTCAADRPEALTSTSLRFIRSAAAALPVSVLEALEDTFGVPVIESYGMTEAAAQICSNPLPPRQRVPGSVGPAGGPEVAVMDDKGMLLPPGRSGEVAIRGPSIISGYEDNPAANAGSFIDGWFRTGDLGVLDDSGYLILKGRKTETIKRGGEKIGLVEVDEALLALPGVAEAAAFGVFHPTLGEDLAAAVVIQPHARGGESSLRAELSERVPQYMVPSRIAIVDALPRTITGKLQRHLLEKLLAGILQPARKAPCDPVTKQLAQAWSRVLGISEIGAEDNFFTLGGDSISGQLLANQLQKEFAVEVPPSWIFRYPTLGEQAGWLAEQGSEI